MSNYQEWRSEWFSGNFEICDYASEITRTNAAWNCPPNASSYPVRVWVHSTQAWSANATTFNNNCSNPPGWDGDRIAYIVIVEGNGFSGGTGSGIDMVKFRPFSGPGPGPITATFYADSGPQTGGAHADGIQFQVPAGAGPFRLANLRFGDYDAGVPTSQAAGGIVFLSAPGTVEIVGAKVIGCNHALNAGGNKHGDNLVVRDSQFRTGSDDHPNCGSFATSNPCINLQGAVLEDIICQRRVNGAWVAVPPSN